MRRVSQCGTIVLLLLLLLGKEILSFRGKGGHRKMRYLVTLNYIDPGPLLPPQQVSDLIKTASLATLDTLARMESEGKIRGGI
jgi:hypothetical protein